MKHYRQPALTCDPVETEEAVEAESHEPGELDGYGICMDCGTNFSANVGLYYCPFCSEDY